MTGQIFINYRRGDAPGFAGRLFDRLEDEFQPEHVFMDVDSIAPGLDFSKVLDEKINQCDVVLSIIGRRWLDAEDERGERRLDNPNDFVRIELEAALRQEKRVIPVLVDGAEMPRLHDLPESLQSFSLRNAVRLTHDRFKADTAGLIRALKVAIAEEQSQQSKQRSSTETRTKTSIDSERVVSLRKTDGVPAGASTLETAKEADETSNWLSIRSSTFAEEFRNHLARFPAGETATRAQSKLESVVWADVASRGDRSAFESYLEEFPNGPNATAARSSVKEIQDQEEALEALNKARKAEETAWSAVKGTNDPDTLRSFLQRWPEGNYAGEARIRMRQKSPADREVRQMLYWLVGIATIAIAIPAATFLPSISLWLQDTSIKTLDDGWLDNEISFTPGGEAILSASYTSPDITTWRTGQRKIFFQSDVPSGFWAWNQTASMSLDGTLMISGHNATGSQKPINVLRTWDMKTSDLKNEFVLKNGYINQIKVLPTNDGVLVAHASENSIVLYDARSGNEVRVFPGHSDGVTALDINSDGAFVVSGGADGTVRSWNVSSGKQLHEYGHDLGEIVDVAIAPNQQLIAASSAKTNEVLVWDFGAGNLVRRLNTPIGGISDLVFTPNSNFIVTGGSDHQVRVWSVETGENVHTFTGHPTPVVAVDVSDDGQFVASSSSNADGENFRMLKIWKFPGLEGH